MKLASIFLVSGINSYSTESHNKKVLFHREGPKLLKTLAEELGITSYDIRNNVGGMAVSGEVTLHADALYLQLFESCVGNRGIRLLYRTCNGRKDCSGGKNHEVQVALLSNPSNYTSFIDQCQQLLPLIV
ncbi:MAG: hypothetical protein Q7S87_19370 [Agitococcus sp.]|nr:hypothetical protein [Agitococcus sp.]